MTVGLTSAPPGTPYHRLGRNASHRWWRPLVGTLLIAGIALQATVALMTIVVVLALSFGADVNLDENSEEIFGQQQADLAVLLGTLAPAGWRRRSGCTW